MARQALSKAEQRVILDRDGHKCVRCGNTTALRLHHIVMVVDGGTNDPGNLTTLCARCHDEWHYIETHYYAWLALLVPLFALALTGSPLVIPLFYAWMALPYAASWLLIHAHNWRETD
jgi:hypothetical protein